MGRVIGNEVRTQGAHISYGPVLDLVRDPRWSRVEETMGEDAKGSPVQSEPRWYAVLAAVTLPNPTPP